ncbi:hypothetical protein ACLB6G_10030 [Zhengella sp. ZM62]|uniref:hypothetical protein n=1 Tax=Zhengella sedimenti TaxID=3390035 RepID=UPI003975E052
MKRHFVVPPARALCVALPNTWAVFCAGQIQSIEFAANADIGKPVEANQQKPFGKIPEWTVWRNGIAGCATGRDAPCLADTHELVKKLIQFLFATPEIC